MGKSVSRTVRVPFDSDEFLRMMVVSGEEENYSTVVVKAIELYRNYKNELWMKQFGGYPWEPKNFDDPMGETRDPDWRPWNARRPTNALEAQMKGKK